MIESTKKIRYKLRYTLIIFPIIILSIVYHSNEFLLSVISLPFQYTFASCYHDSQISCTLPYRETSRVSNLIAIHCEDIIFSQILWYHHFLVGRHIDLLSGLVLLLLLLTSHQHLLLLMLSRVSCALRLSISICCILCCVRQYAIFVAGVHGGEVQYLWLFDCCSQMEFLSNLNRKLLWCLLQAFLNLHIIVGNAEDLQGVY